MVWVNMRRRGVSSERRRSSCSSYTCLTSTTSSSLARFLSIMGFPVLVRCHFVLNQGQEFHQYCTWTSGGTVLTTQLYIFHIVVLSMVIYCNFIGPNVIVQNDWYYVIKSYGTHRSACMACLSDSGHVVSILVNMATPTAKSDWRCSDKCQPAVLLNTMAKYHERKMEI